MVLRPAFLWLSERQDLFNFIKKNGLARKFASRFVAGETVDSAIDVAKDLNAAGIAVSLDLLGESVHDATEAARARDEVLALLERVPETGGDTNVSVKLTQMGLDVSLKVCEENIRAVLESARKKGIFVRLDMESSAYTQRTLDLFNERLHSEFGHGVGVVIQSYMRRSASDIEQLIASQARVRLCKGAYAEPPELAFQERSEVTESFAKLMQQLMERGSYPGIATHDEELIDRTVAFVLAQGIPADRFEFQMLYGVRRDLQRSLRKRGYNMRVYVPFGTQWYPYLMRRLAERPANLAFMTMSVLKETFSGK